MNAEIRSTHAMAPVLEVGVSDLGLFYNALYSGGKEFLEDRNEQMVWRVYSASRTKGTFTEMAQTTEDKIRSFMNLSPGWNHGEGVPPSRQVFQKVMEINGFAIETGFQTDAVPGLNGEIQIVVYGEKKKRNSYLELTVEDAHSVNFTRYDNRKGRWEIKEDRILTSLRDIKSIIKEYGREIHPWHATSEYYRRDTITVISEGFQVRPLRTIRAPYRWYRDYAFQTPEVQYVAT